MGSIKTQNINMEWICHIHAQSHWALCSLNVLNSEITVKYYSVLMGKNCREEVMLDTRCAKKPKLE